jgi:hypothetical protein
MIAKSTVIKDRGGKSVGQAAKAVGPTCFAELRRPGVGRDLAARTAGSPHGPWRLSNNPALTIAIPNVFSPRSGSRPSRSQK